MVNTRGEPPVNVPADIVTVNTPATIMLVPAPAAVSPVVTVIVPGATTASPAPLSVMTILPVEGMRVVGVRDTDKVTPPAPLAALLRVIAGWFVPSVLVMMATNVPVSLMSMITPALSVVAAAMLVDAD